MRFGLCKLLRVLSSMLMEQRYQPTWKKPPTQSNHPAENVNDMIWKKRNRDLTTLSLVLETGYYLDLTSLHLVNMNLDRSPFRLFQIEAKRHFHIISHSEQQIGPLRLFQRMQKVMMSLSRTFLLPPLSILSSLTIHHYSNYQIFTFQMDTSKFRRRRPSTILPSSTLSLKLRWILRP